TIKLKACHAKSSSFTCDLLSSLLYCLILVASGPAQVNTLAASATVAAGDLEQAQQPPRQEPPPAMPRGSLGPGEWNAQFTTQVVDRGIIRLTGAPGRPAEIEDGRLLFRADEVEYNRDTGEITARGHVF